MAGKLYDTVYYTVIMVRLAMVGYTLRKMRREREEKAVEVRATTLDVAAPTADRSFRSISPCCVALMPLSHVSATSRRRTSWKSRITPVIESGPWLLRRDVASIFDRLKVSMSIIRRLCLTHRYLRDLLTIKLENIELRASEYSEILWSLNIVDNLKIFLVYSRETFFFMRLNKNYHIFIYQIDKKCQ